MLALLSVQAPAPVFVTASVVLLGVMAPLTTTRACAAERQGFAAACVPALCSRRGLRTPGLAIAFARVTVAAAADVGPVTTPAVRLVLSAPVKFSEYVAAVDDVPIVPMVIVLADVPAMVASSTLSVAPDAVVLTE